MYKKSKTMKRSRLSILLLLFSILIVSAQAPPGGVSVLYPVAKNGKSGFMDKTGKLVIQAKYESAGDFSEGLASVSMAGKFGYVDATGKEVIAPQFDAAAPFSEGFAKISMNSKY